MIECKILHVNDYANGTVITVEGETNIYDKTKLEEIRNKLIDGYPLTQSRNELPVGISKRARVEDSQITVDIEIPRGVKLSNHVYQSTNDLIKVIKAGAINKVTLMNGYIKLGSDNY